MYLMIDKYIIQRFGLKWVIPSHTPWKLCPSQSEVHGRQVEPIQLATAQPFCRSTPEAILSTFLWGQSNLIMDHLNLPKRLYSIILLNLSKPKQKSFDITLQPNSISNNTLNANGSNWRSFSCIPIWIHPCRSKCSHSFRYDLIYYSVQIPR